MPININTCWVGREELTPTWTRPRIWPTWLGIGQGKCLTTGFCSQPDWVSGASYSEQYVTLARVKPTLALAVVQVHCTPISTAPILSIHCQRTEVGSAKASQYPRHKDRVERGAALDKGADIDTASPLHIDSQTQSRGVMQLPSSLFSVWLIHGLLDFFFPCSFLDSFYIFDFFVHPFSYVFAFSIYCLYGFPS